MSSAGRESQLSSAASCMHVLQRGSVLATCQQMVTWQALWVFIGMASLSVRLYESETD